MEGTIVSRVAYNTPLRVQVWFLRRSRDNWKQKCLVRKKELKRGKNRIAAASKSRARWREEAKRLRQRVRELEAQNVALSNQLAAEKKDGLVALLAAP
jgi:septal ring factor EnvC (AmiA/AmiB activator)